MTIYGPSGRRSHDTDSPRRYVRGEPDAGDRHVRSEGGGERTTTRKRETDVSPPTLCLPMPGEAASHLFQVTTRRYEHGSIILTTKRGIASWGEIFDDTTVAAAILDRLLHHAAVLQIDGDSYRMRDHRARLATLRAGVNHPSKGGEFS
jgi:hypothetical protein